MHCTRENIRINTFMLDPNSYLQQFIERISGMNGGRAFFTNPETLGDYVLVDFVEHKRQLSRGTAGTGRSPRMGRGDRWAG